MNHRMSHLFLFALIAAALIVPLAAHTPAGAQAPWLQLWSVRDPAAPDAWTLEYRDSAGTVLATYQLTDHALIWGFQGGGRLVASGQDDVLVFDPTQGQILSYTSPGVLPDTDQFHYYIIRAIPAPDGQRYAYGVFQAPNDFEAPGQASVYVASVSGGDDRLLFQQQTESFMAVAPFAWSADGSRLMVDDMPQGIGGYILFWTYQNVRVLDIATGATTPIGEVDGYSADFRYVARLDRVDYIPQGITITDLSTGATTTYPLPALGEQPQTGGGAVFSPDNTKVAYQVARQNPEQEKYWTILVDLVSGQSRVILEDEGANYEVRYARIGGWLDANTLAVGETWLGHSAIVDVASGTMLREERGAFLGYAQGVTNVGEFARSGSVAVQCPGAPPSRLTPSARGRVTYTDGTPTNVRAAPSTDAEKVGSVQDGALFTVLDGPYCDRGLAWWYLQFDSGLTGYVGEGTTSSYWLEPWQ